MQTHRSCTVLISSGTESFQASDCGDLIAWLNVLGMSTFSHNDSLLIAAVHRLFNWGSIALSNKSDKLLIAP